MSDLQLPDDPLPDDPLPDDPLPDDPLPDDPLPDAGSACGRIQQDAAFQRNESGYRDEHQPGERSGQSEPPGEESDGEGPEAADQARGTSGRANAWSGVPSALRR